MRGKDALCKLRRAPAVDELQQRVQIAGGLTREALGSGSLETRLAQAASTPVDVKLGSSSRVSDLGCHYSLCDRAGPSLTSYRQICRRPAEPRGGEHDAPPAPVDVCFPRLPGDAGAVQLLAIIAAPRFARLLRKKQPARARKSDMIELGILIRLMRSLRLATHALHSARTVPATVGPLLVFLTAHLKGRQVSRTS